MPITTACDLVSITDTTFYKWMRRGKRADATERGDEVFVHFARAIKKARAEFISRNLHRIEKAAKEPKTWTAAAWLLERRDAENFGRKETEAVAALERRIAELETIIRQQGARSQLPQPEHQPQHDGRTDARSQGETPTS